MSDLYLKKIIKYADQADKAGLDDVADFFDKEIEKTAKKGYHKSKIKEDTVNNHLALFEGYQKAQKHFEKAQSKMFRGKDNNDSPNMGELREIAKGLSHNGNAVFLHELYIQDVYDSKPYGADKSPAIKTLLKDLYTGGYKSIVEDLKRMANIPRSGWVTLSYCFASKKLYLDAFDLHEMGTQPGSIPVLALDMWEHAYISDFGLDKEAYTEWFLDRLDWRAVSKRIKNYQRVR